MLIKIDKLKGDQRNKMNCLYFIDMRESNLFSGIIMIFLTQLELIHNV